MALILIASMAIISITGAFDWESRCTKVTSLTGHLTYKNRHTNEVVVKSAINTNMKLGEIFCFKLENIEKPEETDPIITALNLNKTNLMYQLKLSDVKQVHPIQHHYKFVIPSAIKERCSCNCPCYADAKLHEQNYCRGVAEPCVQFWKADQTNSGCDGTFLCGQSNSETKCSFSIRKSTYHPQTYRGVELGSSTTWAHFILDVYNLEDGDKIGKSVRLATDVSEGQQLYFDDRLSGVMSAVSPGQATIIPSSWYFQHENQGVLYTGIKMNALNEYNLDKLGWLRWDGRNAIFPSKLKDTLQSRFSYSYSNCGEENLHWDFSARFTEKDFKHAFKSELGELYARHLTAVQANEKNVEANLKTSPRMTILLEFEETSDIVFFQDGSTLTDFSVDIRLDKFSNKFLNFTLSQSAGTLVGFLRSTKYNDISDVMFSLYIDSKNPIRTTVQTGISPDVACENDSYSVCLRALSNKEFICKRPIAHCEKVENFVVPGWSKKDEIGDDNTEPSILENFLTFFEHMNPLKWFSALNANIKDRFGWLGFASNIFIILIVIIVIMVIIAKCCFSMNVCCCYKTRRRTERHMYQMTGRTVL